MMAFSCVMVIMGEKPHFAPHVFQHPGRDWFPRGVGKALRVVLGTDEMILLLLLHFLELAACLCTRLG